MKIKNKEQYLKRYRKRGERMQHRTTFKESGQFSKYIKLGSGEVWRLVTPDRRIKEIDHRMKPNHAERTCQVPAHKPVKVVHNHDH